MNEKYDETLRSGAEWAEFCEGLQLIVPNGWATLASFAFDKIEEKEFFYRLNKSKFTWENMPEWMTKQVV